MQFNRSCINSKLLHNLFDNATAAAAAVTTTITSITPTTSTFTNITTRSKRRPQQQQPRTHPRLGALLLVNTAARPVPVLGPVGNGLPKGRPANVEVSLPAAAHGYVRVNTCREKPGQCRVREPVADPDEHAGEHRRQGLLTGEEEREEERSSLVGCLRRSADGGGGGGGGEFIIGCLP